MPTPKEAKRLAALAVTILMVLVFARLGFWQLSRLVERRAFNARLESRLAAAPVPITALPADSTQGHYRRISARGTWDFAHQVALAARSSQGSPGVHLLTPLRLGGDTVVLVNRGWVYAADAMTIDATKWREHEGDTVTVTGYAETWTGREVAPLALERRVVRTLDSSAVASRVGAPILAYYLVQTSDSAAVATRPVRLGAPVLDDGSHRSYAIQWFSFALIAVVGGTLLVREELVRRRASA